MSRQDAFALTAGLLLALLLFGCKQEQQPSNESAESATPADVTSNPPADPTAAKPARETSPAPSQTTAKLPTAKDDRGKLVLSGLTFTVPAEWKAQPVGDSPMEPQAAFTIANPHGEDGMVRISHYPAMRGKDDPNIQRWLMQVSQADGTPSTMDQANIVRAEGKGTQLTILDLSGTVKATMAQAGKPNHRMIAAIINHAQGPHFVVATGDQALMKTWAARVQAFIREATAE